MFNYFNKNWKKLFIFVSFYTVVAIIAKYYLKNDRNEINFQQNLIQITDSNYSDNLPDKWIVVTTISKPSEDIKKIAEIENWQIVIVADERTPKNWSYKNCVFVSIEMQQKMKYKVLQFLPFNSYTRKMVGYLYAIEHGARFIYDTDDDNLPINEGLKLFEYSNYASGLIPFTTQNGNLHEFFNVYSHFGRADVWPRGYPLEFINLESQTSSKLCSQFKAPIIQQGLVDQDADVDAVYRMIFVKNKIKGLNLTFDPIAPPVVLDENVYCPFNSQNTLFHYDAFWALLLPTTVTFRVTDIWRSYWAQRLLHLSGNRLGFHGPNARQNRNSHNYFKDFLEEQQLYNDSASLVQALQRWQCSSNDFQTCIIQLSQLMVHKQFWKQVDLELTKAWISDLNSVGYTFPKYTEPKTGYCVISDFTSNLQIGIRNESNLMNIVTKLNKLCYPVTSTKFHSDGFINPSFYQKKNVILIVIINKQHFTQIPLLQLLYDQWFANVIFCGSFPSNLDKIMNRESLFNNINPSSKFSYVNITSEEWHDGFFGYICLNKIADMKIRNVVGYLTVSDDMLVNFWNHYNVQAIAYSTSSCTINDTWHWWNKPYGSKAIQGLSESLKFYNFNNSHRDIYHKLKDNLLKQVFCGADIYYVPSSLVQQYQFLAQLFFNHKIFLELAVPRILYSLGWANSVPFDDIIHFNDNCTTFNGTYLWDIVPDVYKFYKETDMFLHPVKMSYFENSAHMLKQYCNIYLKSVMNALNEK